MKISILIPVFRNEGSIIITYEKVKELIINLKYEYEFVFVNDGSDDNSQKELFSLYQRDSKVKVLTFSRNFGQVVAIIAGLKEIAGDAVIIMSADLQEPISLIESMIIKWQLQNEIVICNRIDREDSFIANNASKLFYKMMQYVNPKMPKGGFDFFLIDKKAVDVLNQIDERNRFFQGDILWLGFNVAFIPYSRLKRTR